MTLNRRDSRLLRRRRSARPFPRSNAFIADIASLISTGREGRRFRGAWSRPWAITSFTIMPTPTGRFRAAPRPTQPCLKRGDAMATFLNASPAEIAFGPNMTTLTFHLARALGRRLGPGDAIVVTELDHHANIDPWRALERERGVTILQVPMIPETGELDWNDLDRCLNDHRTRLLAIGAASNALGTINDVARAVAMAREAEALSFIDAVHFAPHQLVDVAEWGCDFLACSTYKFYGPHLGVLFGRREQLELA